jgi:hypothetical protein
MQGRLKTVAFKHASHSGWEVCDDPSGGFEKFRRPRLEYFENPKELPL